MSQNDIISWCHSMRAEKIHLNIHHEGWKSCCQRLVLRKKTGWRLSQCHVWTLSSGTLSYCKTLQHQAQVGPSLASWWHTWAPPKALCLVLVLFLTCSLWPFALGRVMVVADCRWSFQTDFLAPSMLLTLPHPGHGYKLCSCFMSWPSFCPVFLSLSLQSAWHMSFIYLAWAPWVCNGHRS